MDNKDFNNKAKIKEMLDRMQSLAKSTVEEFQLTFKEGKVRNYQRDTKVFEFVPEDTLSMTDREVMAEVLHNIGHALFSTRPVLKSLPNPRKKYFQMLNELEDIRVEEQMMQNYPGVFDNFLYKFRKEDAEISTEVEGKLQNDVQFLYTLRRRFWGADMINVKKEVFDALQEAEEYLFEAYGKKTSQELLDYATETIRPIFQKLIPPPEDENDENNGEDNDEKLLNNTANNSLSIEGLKDLMKKLSDAKKQQAKGEESGEEPKQEKADFGKDIDAELDEKSKGESGEANRYGQDDPVLGKNSSHDERKLAQEDYLSYEQMYKEVFHSIPFFVKKLQSIMKDNRYNRQGGSYRSGKLNDNKLFKRKCNSDKIFSRKIIRRHKDYAVTLLIDESGSMNSSEKNRHAAKATVLFSEVLHKVGIPFEIRGFNSSERVYKKFTETFNRKHRRQIERIIIESHGTDAGGNNDGFAVNRAAHHLARHGTPDTEKIMLVLSDGLPANDCGLIPQEDQKRLPSSKHNYGDFDLHYEVAQASRRATVIGIGINARHVTEYYQQNVTCEDVSELPRLVLNKLKQNIHRG